MNSENSILIIDDEVQIRRLLEITLTQNGYKVREAINAKAGVISAVIHHPSIILLDLGLPDEDGQSILVKLRERYKNPIIILSVRNSEDEIIKALDNGAIDYLTKPFRTGELLIRLKSIFRLIEQNLKNSPVLTFQSLSLDLTNHIVRKNDEILKLTSTEFNLLALMAKNSGRVLTRQFILKEIWGYGYIEQTQYLHVYIAQLRKKIENNPTKPKIIITESGIGYRFCE